MTGTSINTLMKIEQGRVASPGVFGIERVAHALGTGIGELVGVAMAESPAGPDLVSVGYEGQGLTGFVGSLRAQGVEILADVRLTPISRKKGFSKTALRAALADAGVD